jgi:catechol 2,3-dioxygenase-like lactoylglutathione lyase family enzyme
MTEATTGSTVKIIGMHHSGIPCNDLDRAVDFYTHVLGMDKIAITPKGILKRHFTGSNVPDAVAYEAPDAEKDYAAYVDAYREARDGRDPDVRFARMLAGDTEVVLFERPEPIEIDTLIENCIFHQSFHISPADMDHLAELKRRGDSGIRFHNGPTLRWPHGRALYLWDTEGNYIELESEEDLPAQFGLKK